MSDTAYAPTVHHSRREGGTPSCGTIGSTLVDTDWSTVTCKRCYKSDAWYAHHAAEQQRIAKEKALTDAAVQKAVNEVFAKAREIADRAGYCSTYQEIESEIIADLPYEVAPTIREYEVEVEEEIRVRIVRTITVEAESAEAAEEKAGSDDAAEERIPLALQSIFVEGGYHDSTEVEVMSASAS